MFARTETIGRQRDGNEARGAWVSVSLDDHRLKDARSYSGKRTETGEFL